MQTIRKCITGLLLIVLISISQVTLASNKLELKRVFKDITFQSPLGFVADPNKSNVWYVVEKAGRVLRIEKQGTKTKSTVFIDIWDRVEAGYSETGLLGLAFDPGFKNNGRVFLSYNHTEESGRIGSWFGKDVSLVSVLSEFKSKDTGLTLDVESEIKLLQVEQPYTNHNGGDIHFGPDGYLYYGLGDGGSGGDPKANGQNTNTLLGAMLRIDVSKSGSYKIPDTNPFAKGGGKAEIFAYGLRNPWRWSFDRQTGDLWLADVGQEKWEEINRITSGGNYGWNLREGKHCYAGNCQKPNLIDPLVEYSHDHGCSVTGGYVYRGKAIPSLNGTYIYGDYCSGIIWGYDVKKTGSTENRVLLDTDLNISSFGEDNNGEIYVVDLKGKIFKIVQK